MKSFLTKIVTSFLALALVISVCTPLLAAAQRGLSLTFPEPVLPVPANPPVSPPPASAYQPAPLPNRDVDSPRGPRASKAPSVAPNLFTRSDTYRGEGFNSGSTAQSEQEKRARPAAGLSLRLPLTGN